MDDFANVPRFWICAENCFCARAVGRMENEAGQHCQVHGFVLFHICPLCGQTIRGTFRLEVEVSIPDRVMQVRCKLFRRELSVEKMYTRSLRQVFPNIATIQGLLLL